MQKLTQEKIDNIKAIPIPEIANKIGITFKDNKAKCPFHTDKTPSLHYWEEKNLYHCFGCGESGDGIKLVMKHCNVDFVSACELITGESLRLNGVDFSRKHGVESIIEEVKQIYKDNLKKHTNIIDWIKAKYGYNDKTIDKEDIGFSLEGNHLWNILKKKYSESELLSTGLFWKNGNDIYQNRVVFWINDYYSTGRLTDETPKTDFEQSKKYINQLTKSENNNFVSNFVGKNYDLKKLNYNKLPVLYITEGQTDAIMLHQLGYNAIAIGGVSAIRDKKLETFLRELSKKNFEVILAFDSDFVNVDLAYEDKNYENKRKALFYFSSIIKTILLDLPQLKDSMKTDICEFIVNGGDILKVRFKSIEDFARSGNYDYEELWELRYNKDSYRSVMDVLSKENDFDSFVHNFKTFLLDKGKKQRLPYGYAIIDDKTVSVAAINESYIKEGFFVDQRNIVSNQPIWLSAKVRNIDDDSEGIEITYIFDNETRTMITRRDVIESTSYKVLLNKGIKVSPKTKNNLSHYFDSFEEKLLPLKLVSSKLGWTNTKQASYMLDNCIGDEIKHQNDNNNFEELKPKGDYETWKGVLNNEVMKNPAISIAIGSSLASTLLKFSNVPNFILHLSGDSGTGKTTAMRIASSIFGNPNYGLSNERSFIKSWNGTLNALADVATTYSDLPFFLDELTNARMEATQLIYDYSNGTERIRMNRNSEIKSARTYRGVLISTGENPIIADEDLARKGELVRVIDYNISDAFKYYPKRYEKVEFIKHIESTITKNYGQAIRTFIVKLIKELDKDDQYLNKQYAYYYNYLRKEFGEENNRKLQSYAIIIVALELFIKFLDFDKVNFQEIISEILDFIKKDLTGEETTKNEEEKVVDYLLQQIESNPDKLPDRNASTDKLKDIWGTTEYEGFGPNKTPKHIYLISSSLKKMFDGSKWSISTVKKKLAPYCEEDTKGKIQRKIRTFKNSYQCIGYVIDLEKLEAMSE